MSTATAPSPVQIVSSSPFEVQPDPWHCLNLPRIAQQRDELLRTVALNAFVTAMRQNTMADKRAALRRSTALADSKRHQQAGLIQ